MSASVIAALSALGAAVIAASGAGLVALTSRRPARARLKLVDAHVENPFSGTTPPVVDIKLRNTGGQTTVAKRVTLSVLWAREIPVLDLLNIHPEASHPLALEPSAVYDVDMPDPAQPSPGPVKIHVAQALAGGAADRFQIRLHAKVPQGRAWKLEIPGAVWAYLLEATVVSDEADDSITSTPIAVACPGNSLRVPTPEVVRQRVGDFRVQVADVRNQVDRELVKRGRAPADWDADPPLSRSDLPNRLTALSTGRIRDDSNFWRSEVAVSEYLDNAERVCRAVIDALSALPPGKDHDGLDGAIDVARRTIEGIPALHKELMATL